MKIVSYPPSAVNGSAKESWRPLFWVTNCVSPLILLVEIDFLAFTTKFAPKKIFRKISVRVRISTTERARSSRSATIHENCRRNESRVREIERMRSHPRLNVAPFSVSLPIHFHSICGTTFAVCLRILSTLRVSLRRQTRKRHERSRKSNRGRKRDNLRRASTRCVAGIGVGCYGEARL